MEIEYYVKISIIKIRQYNFWAMTLFYLNKLFPMAFINNNSFFGNLYSLFNIFLCYNFKFSKEWRSSSTKITNEPTSFTI